MRQVYQSFSNQEVVCAGQVNYLAVALESKLKWKAHVNGKCRKAIVAFSQLCRTIGKTWGYSPKVVHWIYTMVIRPMLTYAAVVWWPRINYSTVDMQLEHVQRLACLYHRGNENVTYHCSGNDHWLASTVCIHKATGNASKHASEYM